MSIRKVVEKLGFQFICQRNMNSVERVSWKWKLGWVD